MDMIDLARPLNEILQRHGTSSPEAIHEAAALWGGAPCNKHGVITATDFVWIELPHPAGWNAAIDLAETPNGWWQIATSYNYANGGGSSPLSVWARSAYTSRDAAIAAGIAALTRTFESVRTWHGSQSGRQSTLAARMIEQLTAHQDQARQLALF